MEQTEMNDFVKQITGPRFGKGNQYEYSYPEGVCEKIYEVQRNIREKDSLTGRLDPFYNLDVENEIQTNSNGKIPDYDKAENRLYHIKGIAFGISTIENRINMILVPMTHGVEYILGCDLGEYAERKIYTIHRTIKKES